MESIDSNEIKQIKKSPKIEPKEKDVPISLNVKDPDAVTSYSQRPLYANQTFLYNSSYGQPIMPGTIQQNGIIINQTSPIILQKKLTIYPEEMNCPYCMSRMTTKVEQSFNCCTCFACFLLITFLFPLAIFTVVAGNYTYNNGGCTCDCEGCCECKCCCDATHVCPNCGKVVASYNSCTRR